MCRLKRIFSFGRNGKDTRKTSRLPDYHWEVAKVSERINVEEMEAIERLYESLHLATEHYIIYQSLKGKSENVNIIDVDRKQFMVLTQDAHIQMYIEIWCKVFGSERNNDMHWKRFVSEEEFLLELSEKGIGKDDFEKKSQEMKEFRNKYISHSDSDYPMVPILDGTIDVLCAFDRAVEQHCQLNSEIYSEMFGTLDDYVDARKNAYFDIVDELAMN